MINVIMMSEQTIKERIILFLKYLKTGQTAYEKHVGLSNGFISNISNAIGTDKIQKIYSKNPELNIIWLITGEGEMLKPVRVIDRFDRYIKYKGLTDVMVINNLNWSKSVFLGIGINSLDTVRKAGEDFTLRSTEQILKFYTDINPTWLKTGNGSMLIDKTEKEVFSQTQVANENALLAVYEKQLIEKENQIGTLQKENKELSKQIGRLEGKLEGELKGKDEVINILKDELRLLKKDFPTPNVQAAKRAV